MNTINMIFEGEDPLACDNVGIYQMGNQGQFPQETKASTSKSIIAFHEGTCATSTCAHGIYSEGTKSAKAQNMEKSNHRK